MATRQISLIGGLNPDTSGNAWFEPSSVALTNDRFPGMVLRLKDTATKIKASGSFTVPNDYVGTPQLVIIWATSATTGNCVFDAEAKAIAAGESMDPSTDDDAATVTTAAAGSAFLHIVSTITLSGTYVADDLVQLSVGRDGTASDTMAADALVWDVLFQYSDT